MTFDQAVSVIANNYEKTGNKLSWRFLLTSKNTLLSNNGIFLITSNPGGDKIPINHPKESYENGCAYINEKWDDFESGKAPLQLQIQNMYKLLSEYENRNYNELLINSLVGYFIPYRSKGLSDLNNKNMCYKIGREIWGNILKENIPRIIICIDKETANEINRILISADYIEYFHEKKLIGWGDYKAEIIMYKKNNIEIKVIRFPHLGRFKIFGRNKSEDYLRKIFDLMYDKRGA